MKFRYEPETKPLDGYTIKRAIDRGGFGEVYYALSEAGKEVALKLLQDNLDVELRGVAQCLNLKHPNLMTIFDVRKNADGEHWVVMEFVSGKGLDRIITENPDGLPPKDVEKYLTQICDGVAYLHDKGIVHRDLKPANIYQEEGQIKIGDVGLAKFIAESKRSAQTQSVGTVYYMAPEIALGRYGKEVDVYAIAVMLFELLTGKVPFEGETSGEVLMKHLSATPDVSVLPPTLRPVLQRALEKDPLKRTPNAGQLAKEFRSALGLIEGEYGAFQRAAVVPPPQPAAYPPAGGYAQPQPAAQPRHAVPQGRPGYPQAQLSDHHQHIPEPWYRDSKNWLIIGGCTAFTVVFAPWVLVLLVPLMLIGGLVGVSYWVIRLIGRAFIGDPDGRYAYEEQLQSDPRHSRGVRLNATRYFRNRTPITERPLRMSERIAESSGSMAVAAVCAALVSAALWGLNTIVTDPAEATLFGIVTTLGAWAAILPGKFWEGRGGDGVMRRMLTALLGGLVGVGAFFVDDSLGVDLPVHDYGGLTRYISESNLLPELSASGAARIVGYSLFFGILMLARRWWYHVDAFRPGRFRISTVFWTAMVAWLLAMVGRFPMEWAVMWGIAISTTAQLASVWVQPESRSAASA